MREPKEYPSVTPLTEQFTNRVSKISLMLHFSEQRLSERGLQVYTWKYYNPITFITLHHICGFRSSNVYPMLHGCFKGLGSLASGFTVGPHGVL